MTPSPAFVTTTARPWWAVLLLIVSAGLVAGAWWAGLRAERQQEPLADTGATSTIRKTPFPGPGQPDLGASAGLNGTTGAPLRATRLPGAASAPTLGAELSPLPWPFWEFRLKQALPPRSPPLVPPPWRMIGATESGGVWSLVVLRQGRTAPEFFKVGESLPGGYRVAAISQDDVTLDSGGRSVVLSFIGTR